MLVEDTAVAHWLTDHPDVTALEEKWREHLDASKLGDYNAQQELGLTVDQALAEWYAAQDPDYLIESDGGSDLVLITGRERASPSSPPGRRAEDPLATSGPSAHGYWTLCKSE